MRIWIMRHGQAEAMHGNDAERALTKHGLAQAEAAGRWLAAQGVTGIRVAASPYRRAQQTAARVAAQIDSALIEAQPLLQPESDPRRVCQWLAAQGDRELLLVSHMPLVAQLVAWLEEGVLGGGLPFATAELRALDCDLVAPGLAYIAVRHGAHD